MNQMRIHEPERRVRDLIDIAAELRVIRDELQEAKEAQRILSEQVAEHIESDKYVRPRMEEVLTAFERSKGALYALSMLGALAGAVIGFLSWSKDHIRWG